MENEKIIVTGGMGFIGSHTVVSLIEKGYEVVIIDNLINSTINTLDGIEDITGVRPSFINIDMQSSDLVNDCLAEHKEAIAVIHFAALKAVGESTEKPVEYYRNNLFALLNLLSGMQKNKMEKLVFSSSCTVYGEPDTLPLTEQNKTKPAMSPYGNTKKIGEEILKDLTKSDGSFKIVSLRYFNPIGAHPSGKIGELPNGIPNNLMPFITQTAIGIREELLVFGSDYDTEDGTAIRDYIHVVDVADAHVKTVERLINNDHKTSFEVFNIGTGKGSSVLDVIKSFEKTTGIKIPYKLVGRRDGDVASTYASTELATKELKWKAKYDLDDMTSSSWAWEKKNRKI